MIHTPNVWYFPANYGDIRLERAGDKSTKVIYFKLNPSEVEAMKALREASVSLRRRWTTEEAWAAIQNRDFKTGEAAERVITLDGSIAAVGRFLRKQLRPDRETVTVIRIGDGKIEEMRDQEHEVAEAKPEAKPDATVSPAAGDPDEGSANEEGEETALAKTGTDDAAPVKAVTVKKPTVGCPAPSFAQIKLRATRVLRAFLTPKQVDDFNRHQRFVSTGADTGHRYMLTSRNAPDELKNFGSRCVFDLDENRSYCVHDYDIPAEEELLTLHCLLSIPGYETWARGMRDNTADGLGTGAVDTLLAGV
jgi:hypothetical protein